MLLWWKATRFVKARSHERFPCNFPAISIQCDFLLSMDMNEWTSHECSGEEARIQHICYRPLVHIYQKEKIAAKNRSLYGLEKDGTDKRLVFRLSGKVLRQSPASRLVTTCDTPSNIRAFMIEMGMAFNSCMEIFQSFPFVSGNCGGQLFHRSQAKCRALVRYSIIMDVASYIYS